MKFLLLLILVVILNSCCWVFEAEEVHDVVDDSALLAPIIQYLANLAHLRLVLIASNLLVLARLWHNEDFSEAGIRIARRPIEVLLLLLIMITVVGVSVSIDRLLHLQLLVAEEFIGPRVS